MRRLPWPVLVGSLLIFLLSYFSINTDVGSDPQLTLLVSQALVDHGTLHLDAYVDDTILGRPFDSYRASGVIQETGGHMTHYFPAGPSLVAAPFVGLARLAGWDMRSHDNYRLQEILSALTAAAAFALGYALARCYVAERPALVIALVSVLGSSLISTLGTAYWSHNPAVLFIGGALWLLARVDGGHARAYHPFALGAALFVAFMCRASAVAFIAPVFGYLAVRDRRALILAGATALALLLIYLLVSVRLTGAGVSDYYSPERLVAERAPLWVGVVGNLISPGRGLFVFSPFLLVVVVGLVAFRGRLWRRPMLWLCLIWFALHLAIVARAASWWGGWSFGPRLLTDLWPGLIVLTALWWSAVVAHSLSRARPWAVAYLCLALPAVLFHVGLGLNSQPASRWNAAIDPTPDEGPATGGDLFNWQYTQVAATNAMLCRIERDKFGGALAPSSLLPYTPGQTIPFDADQIAPRRPAAAPATTDAPPTPSQAAAARAFLPALFTPANTALYLGWAEPTILEGGGGFRWSQCERTEIRFWLADAASVGEATLVVRGRALGAQRVRIDVNDTFVGEQAWQSAAAEQSLRIPAGLLRPGAANVLTFHFPDAHAPSLRDQRPLGLALESVALWLGEPPVASPSPPEVAYPAP